MTGDGTPALSDPPTWEGPSTDPNDEQFGDVVVTASVETAGEFDAVLVGEPYDGAVIGRRGAREGPAAIREALAATKTHHFERGPVSSVADLGDVALPAEPDSTGAVQSRAWEVTSAVHRTETFPVFLGGDNSLTVPNVAPLLGERDGKGERERDRVGVVSFDAHLDCREVRGDPTSGTPYRQLHESGLDRLVVVGARDFETSTAYADYLAEQGGVVVTAEEAAGGPGTGGDGTVGSDVETAADRVAEATADLDTLYVSLDVDVLDAAAAPGVSAPTPGGLTTRELYRLLAHVVADDRVAGFEVVECAPPLDEGERTVRAASRAVAHVLAARGAGGTDTAGTATAGVDGR